MKTFLTSLAILLALFAQGQGAEIGFKLVFEGQPLELGRNYFSEQLQDSIRFDMVRFYVSDLSVRGTRGELVAAPAIHHLLDAAEPRSLSVRMPDLPGQVQEVRFNLGIDSLTNVSGAMGGDLDPTKGMYWAWQSGYVNVKIEGSSPLCPARKHKFQFHIGGYLPPHAAVQTVVLEAAESKPTVQVELAQCLAARDLRQAYRIMDPSPAGVEFAQSFVHAFTLVP